MQISVAPPVPDRPLPIKQPFDPATSTAVPFGRSTSIRGEATLDLVFAPFEDGFRRFDTIHDAREAAYALAGREDRTTAVAVQHGADGAAYLGEVRIAGTLEPAFFATHARRFEQPAFGAGVVIDYAAYVAFGTFEDSYVRITPDED